MNVLQLCAAVDLLMVSVCDTPGFMMGRGRRAAIVRHILVLVTEAQLTVPWVIIVLRKGNGLGSGIEAAEPRRRIVAGRRSVLVPPPRIGRKHPTWVRGQQRATFAVSAGSDRR